jgi:predicted nucleic acid-binding protein
LSEYEKHGVGQEVREFLHGGFFMAHRLRPSEARQAEALSQTIAFSPLSRDPVSASHLVDAEAIILAQRSTLGADFVLMDELAAREVARALPVPVIGFVGVLRLAFERRLVAVDEIEEALRECQRQGTHYSDALIEQFVRSLRERPP